MGILPRALSHSYRVTLRQNATGRDTCAVGGLSASAWAEWVADLISSDDACAPDLVLLHPDPVEEEGAEATPPESCLHIGTRKTLNPAFVTTPMLHLDATLRPECRTEMTELAQCTKDAPRTFERFAATFMEKHYVSPPEIKQQIVELSKQNLIEPTWKTRNKNARVPDASDLIVWKADEVT